MKKLILLIFLLFIPLSAFSLDVELTVKETRGVKRTGEMVHNGVPIAKVDNVLNSSLLLVSDGTTVVPATFEVLARWGGGKDDTTKPIRWLLVSFPATVPSGGTETYYIRDYGTPAIITNQIVLTDGPSSITIDTGPSEFVISEVTATLFDSITVNGSALASLNSSHNSTISGQTEASANTPTVTIERQNEHYVCIKSVGTYANTPVGANSAQPVHYRIRYEFFAGSPTAVITQKFFWPGYSSSNPADANPITVSNVNVILPDINGYTSTDVYSNPTTFYTGVTGETSTISQDRRAVFSAPQQSTVSHGATSQTTIQATTSAIINRATNGALVASIGDLYLFEPQSIASTSAGKITLTTMGEDHDFQEAQGTWSRFAVGAVGTSSTFAEIRELVIEPVQHRLVAIPITNYIKTTDFHDNIPDITSTTTEVQAWWNELTEVCSTTETFLDTEKFYGLMTWGGLVRASGETGVSAGWDKIYDGAFLTDYHNAWKQMTIHGLLSADPDQLQVYGFNGARRMLHTQSLQVDDYTSPSSGLMGWGFAGYNRYRSDGNSSHTYFENLYLYYYLTGDLEVVDFCTAGAKTKSTWYTRDGSGNLNDESDRGTAFIDYSDRVFYQSSTMFEFVGHASDVNYLDDWVHMYNHMATTNLLLLDSAGSEYGFLTEFGGTISPAQVNQSWMDALYPTQGLYRLYKEYGNIQIGIDDISISRILGGIGRSFWAYNRTTPTGSTGDWGGDWANIQTVTFTGDSIGGGIQSVVHTITPSDPLLYNNGKANVATTIIRAGEITGDSTLRQNGLDGLTWVTEDPVFLAYNNEPLDKTSGIAFSRLADGLSYFDTISTNPIVTLPSDYSTTSSTTSFQGTAGAQTGTIASVVSDNGDVTIGSGAGTANVSFTVSNVNLALGLNTVIVTATDTEANTGNDSIGITRTAVVSTISTNASTSAGCMIR